MESDDARSPLNLSAARKWSIVAFLSAMTFTTNFVIFSPSPALPQIIADLHAQDGFARVFIITIFDLGETIVPLAIGPLSERFGRLRTYHVCNACFILACLVAGFSVNLPMMLIFRLLGGASTACMVLNPAIVGDMFPRHRRGSALAIMSITPLFGTVMGPLVGGYVAQTLNWRWTFWLSAIVAAVFETGLAVTLRETYIPFITRVNRSTGLTWESKQTINFRGALLTMVNPIRLLAGSFAAWIIAAQVAILYSCQYLTVSTMSSIYQNEYGFSVGSSGLTVLGITTGALVGTLYCRLTLDRMVTKTGGTTNFKRQPIDCLSAVKGKAQPIIAVQVVETDSTAADTTPAHDLPTDRLLPAVPAGVLMPVGLLAYGWMVERHAAWIAPIVISSLMGFGLAGTTTPFFSFILDTFGDRAASAMAAAIALRNLVGSLLPIAGPYLFARLGYGWGNALLAFVGLAFAPMPLWLFLQGRRKAKGGVISTGA